MNAHEFRTKQFENMSKLLKQPKPKTQIEKDIFNLKYVRYGIGYGSIQFRSGVISSLDRAIKLLEKEQEKEQEKEVKKVSESTGWDNPPKFNSIEERDLYYK